MLRTKQIPDPPDSYLENGEAQRGSQPNSLHFHLPNTVEYFIKFENVLQTPTCDFLKLPSHLSSVFRPFFIIVGTRT